MSNLQYNNILRNIAKRLLRSSSSRLLNRVGSFKNRHKGESCYIIGDGISIKYFDLKSLPSKITIACNYSIFHNEINSLNLKYAISYAPFFHKAFLGGYSKEQIEILKLTSKLTKQKIDELSEVDFFSHVTNFPFLRRKNCYYLMDHIPLGLDDAIHEINNFKNVIESSIVLAIYMGFDDINLLGFDYLHDPSTSHHWYEKGKGVVTNVKTKEKKFIESVKKFANISSITVDSQAQVTKHIYYQNIAGTRPAFKENVELASKEVLDSLAIFNDYKIY